MKIARSLGSTLRLAARLSIASPAWLAVPVVAPVVLSACADENDPQTWVKRLDDPAQRPAAIKRLSQFFEDGMTKANKDRNDASIKALLDKIVEPMTKQYTAGNLDEKTRKELAKFLADTRDPRTAPALAKAFNEYEPGKNDDDVKYAAQASTALAQAGLMTDQNLVDALWNCFSKFQASKAKSSTLPKEIHDAILAVKSPTYGPKAVEKLAGPVDPKNPESVRDQINFWQTTAVQLIGELKYTAAARPLVTTLLTPAKAGLRGSVRTALLKIPKEAETNLIAALNGTDPAFAKLGADFGPDKTQIAIIADALANISRPAGRDALLKALDTADNDTNRVVIAQSLQNFPADPRLVPAFEDAYKKTAPNFQSPMLGGDSGRTALMRAVPLFFNPDTIDWILAQAAAATGDETEALQSAALQAAMKLMPAAKTKAVADATAKMGSALEKQMLPLTVAAADKCDKDAACYTKLLDEPIPSSPRTANAKAIKAAYMTGVYGNAGTGRALVPELDKVKDPGTRLAIAEAVNHLLHDGDNTAANGLEKIIEGDKATGNQGILESDDAVAKVALRLRARTN